MITPNIDLTNPDSKDSELLRDFLEWTKTFQIKFVSSLPDPKPTDPTLFVVANGSTLKLTAAINSKYYQVTMEEV